MQTKPISRWALYLLLGSILTFSDWLTGGETMTMQLTSPAFTEGGPIPALYTCEGGDISPALRWTGVPEQARALVLIVDDPDAPDPRAPRMTWVHWVLYNLPPETRELAEATPPTALRTVSPCRSCRTPTRPPWRPPCRVM